MKRLVVLTVLSVMLTCISSNFNVVMAQDGVTDSLSIDDMAPVLYQEEEVDEPAKTRTGVYVSIAAGVAVAVVVGMRVVKKKK